MKVLKKHNIIEFASKEEEGKFTEQLSKEIKAQIKASGKKIIWYRLAPKSIDLAMSLINLEHSKKVSKYAQETHYFTQTLIWFTKILVVITIGMLLFAFVQSLISLWF